MQHLIKHLYPFFIMKRQYFIIGISTAVFLLFYFLIPVATIGFGSKPLEMKIIVT